MKNDNKHLPAASIVEDGALGGLKKRLRDAGLIVNAGKTEAASRPGPKIRKRTGSKKKGGNR